LLLCLVSQIVCVELFHVFNIWLYTSPLDQPVRCNYAVKMVVLFYLIQCFFLYLFLMHKVRTTLIAQTKFTHLLDVFLRILTFGVIPTLMILVFLLFSGSFLVNGAGLHICVMNASPYWVIVLVLLDIVLNAGFLLLFILPINQLLQAGAVIAKSNGAVTDEDVTRRRLLMQVARRNLLATSICVFISVAALSLMIWEAYAENAAAKIFGCLPCVIASTTNTFLMLITTKGAWTWNGSSQVEGRHKSMKSVKTGPHSTNQNNAGQSVTEGRPLSPTHSGGTHQPVEPATMTGARSETSQEVA
jgi:hypothetical protein